MDNRFDELDATMRKIAARRDKALQSDAAISAGRLHRLQAALASELPLQTTLFEIAKQRDEMLRDVPGVPPEVNAALTEQLLAQAAPALRAQQLTTQWDVGHALRRLARAPISLSLAAAVVVLAAGVVLVGQRSSRSTNQHLNSAVLQVFAEPARNEAVPNRATSVRPGDALLPAFRDQLTLTVTTAELASLQAPLLTAGYLPDRSEAGLPLDLPLRQSLIDAAVSRTP